MMRFGETTNPDPSLFLDLVTIELCRGLWIAATDLCDEPTIIAKKAEPFAPEVALVHEIQREAGLVSEHP